MISAFVLVKPSYLLIDWLILPFIASVLDLRCVICVLSPTSSVEHDVDLWRSIKSHTGSPKNRDHSHEVLKKRGFKSHPSDSLRSLGLTHLIFTDSVNHVSHQFMEVAKMEASFGTRSHLKALLGRLVIQKKPAVQDCQDWLLGTTWSAGWGSFILILMLMGICSYHISQYENLYKQYISQD